MPITIKGGSAFHKQTVSGRTQEISREGHLAYYGSSAILRLGSGIDSQQKRETEKEHLNLSDQHGSSPLSCAIKKATRLKQMTLPWVTTATASVPWPSLPTRQLRTHPIPASIKVNQKTTAEKYFFPQEDNHFAFNSIISLILKFRTF